MLAVPDKPAIRSGGALGAGAFPVPAMHMRQAIGEDMHPRQLAAVDQIGAGLRLEKVEPQEHRHFWDKRQSMPHELRRESIRGIRDDRSRLSRGAPHGQEIDTIEDVAGEDAVTGCAQHFDNVSRSRGRLPYVPWKILDT